MTKFCFCYVENTGEKVKNTNTTQVVEGSVLKNEVHELTAVITLGAVNESLWFAFLVGLFTLLANATYSIGNDLRLQGQNKAIKTNQKWVSCSHGQYTVQCSRSMQF